MSGYLTAIPAYGRDYKNGKELLEHWQGGKDFIVCNAFSKYDGKPFSINDRESLKAEGIKQIHFRYKNLTQIKTVKL